MRTNLCQLFPRGLFVKHKARADVPTWLPPAPHADVVPDKPKPCSPDARTPGAYFSGLEMRTPFREGVEGRNILGGGAWVEYYKAQFSHSDREGLCLELQVPYQ